MYPRFFFLSNQVTAIYDGDTFLSVYNNIMSYSKCITMIKNDEDVYLKFPAKILLIPWFSIGQKTRKYPFNHGIDAVVPGVVCEILEDVLEVEEEDLIYMDAIDDIEVNHWNRTVEVHLMTTRQLFSIIASEDTTIR
ncbi:hypothetical protein BDB01DRAFT_840237 [Pilobolus umbonatus]|nr:hypothetical protein BDB01DRAFT_840237 [Pilobolus umbonatus]